MSNLDWSKISNQFDLHHLVNRIFDAEYPSRYTAGVPNRGKDRGWDGRLAASLHPRPDDRPGIGMVQAKYTKTNGAAAKRQLLKDMVGVKGSGGELQKAIDAKADYIHLATNADLDVDQIAELEQCGDVRGMPVRVSARYQLEMLLGYKDWLKSQFFGMQAHPSLLPLGDAPPKPLRLIAFPFRGRQALKKEALQTLSDHSVIVFYGPGGCGKSRLAYEVGRELSHSQELHVRGIRGGHGLASASDTLAKEIHPAKPYLLLIDDAERDYEVAIQAFARATNDSMLQLILVSRTGPHHDLLTKLSMDGVRATGIEVTPIESHERIELLQEVMDISEVEAEQIEEQTDGNLFLQACIATRHVNAHSAAFDPTHIRPHINNVTVAQAKKALEAAQIKSHRDLLALVALLAAVPPEEARQLISTRTQLSTNEFSDVAHALVGAQVFRWVARGLRYDADMVGDIVLWAAFQGPTATSLARFVFDEVYPGYRKACLEALASCVDVPLVHTELTKKFHHQLADVKRRGDPTVLAAHLREIERLCTSFPDYALSLARTAVAVEPSNVATSAEWYQVVRRVGKDPAYTKPALDLLLTVGTVGGDKSEDKAIATWCNILKTSPATATQVIEAFEEYVKLTVITSTQRRFLLQGLDILLGGALEDNQTSSKRMAIRWSHLRRTPEVLALRERSLGVLCALLSRVDAADRLAGLEAARKIGLSRGIDDGTSPFQDDYTAEKR